MPRTVEDIQTDLDEAYAARRVALKAQSYSSDSGQSKQSVSRASLSDINKTIRELQIELENASAIAGGAADLVGLDFERF